MANYDPSAVILPICIPRLSIFMSKLYCPICKETLVESGQQLRADDEESTLVSLCPVHGKIGTTVKQYID